MKLQSISIMRWNSDSEEPILLDGAYNLAEYSFFTRGNVKEFLAFGSRTIMKRIGAGTQGVDYEGNMVFCHVLADGLGVVVFCDKEYPARVAVSLSKEVLAAFKGLHDATWRACKVEGGCKLPKLETMLAEYMEPAKVDKLMKLDQQLHETKDILVKTIDKVLQRGEKLDDLVEKSGALSNQSKQFYKAARKTNSCFGSCAVM